VSTHLYLALAVFVVGLGAVALGVAGRRRAVSVAAVLAEDDPESADMWQQQLEEPARVRLLTPVAETFVGLIRRFLPGTHLDLVRRRLLLAGLAGKLRAEEYVALQVLSTGLGAVAGFSIWDGTPRGLALALIVVGMGVFAPRGLLDGRRRARVDQIQRELPDVIDLLAICVEAGQGLEGAMLTVAQRGEGAMSPELRHTLREMELGVSRRSALEHLRDRLDIPDIAALVAALIQADVLGTPVGDALKTQAVEQRRRRRQQVREQAAKLPVKILFPLTFFILPALFVVLMGPAVLRIMAVFQ
jgi:tight adherence protein C